MKALLATPSPSGKHARWWLQVFGSGVRKVDIIYRPGKQNLRADALSWNPIPADSSESITLSAQIAEVSSEGADISQLLDVTAEPASPDDFSKEQQKDPELQCLYLCLQYGILPEDEWLCGNSSTELHCHR